jgi:hypothetical protein
MIYSVSQLVSLQKFLWKTSDYFHADVYNAFLSAFVGNHQMYNFYLFKCSLAIALALFFSPPKNLFADPGPLDADPVRNDNVALLHKLF